MENTSGQQGQQVSADQIFQQDPKWLQENYPQIYSQYVEKVGQPGAGLTQTQTQTQATQAQIPGIQAQSSKEQIQAQQTGALQNLHHDLVKNKMTLPSAISKYTSLGMSADDVFRNYLSESPWGLPNQNPQQLQQMGVSADALGKIGTPGSFMDKYNTRNAVQGLRNLEDLWGKTDSGSRLMGALGLNVDSSNYNTARSIFGNHLSTLIPGAPGGQQTAQDLLNTIPNSSDPREDIPGKASGQFRTIEEQLLKTKGYNPRDIGLPSREAKSATGGDLLKGILQTALPTGGAVGGGMLGALFPGLGETGLSEAAGAGVGGAGGQYLADMLTGKKPGADVATTGALSTAGGALAKPVAKVGGALFDYLNPGRIISKTGAARDALVNTATKEGAAIDGNKILKGITQWASSGKRGNLGQGQAIDQAVEDAKQVFGGQKLSPAEAMSAYNEADSGFTRTGLPKTPIQANIDRGLRQILSSELDKEVPGWRNLTAKMAKAYATQKSPVRQGVKNIAKYSIPLAAGGAAGGVLNNYLFGEK